ncbi:hypothetical protein G6L12_08085 [Agrobacterium rhizogenes]|nr:hypothetical protein [Rhizobium rhizogenes]NTF74431.1 hypothetical protein [Rhizobium rhizogenes]
MMTKIPKEAVDRALSEAGSAWGMHLTAENKRNLMEAAISVALPHLAKPVDGERHEMVAPEGWVLVPKQPTKEMAYKAACAHYGVGRVNAVGGIEGISMTVDSIDYNFQRAFRRFWKGALAASPTAPPPPAAAQEPVHPDDEAVDRFAIAMKAKLAEKRAQGYGGWDRPEECTIGHLSQLLRKHIDKGDAVDVGNFSMMIHQRGGSIK